MLRAQRHDKILEFLHLKNTVSVEELVYELNTSPATVRRDLDFLAKENLLERTRGGARAVQATYGRASRVKGVDNIHNKNKIGAYALSLIQPDSVIGVTGGSTVLSFMNNLIPWVTENSSTFGYTITVVTNSLDVASLIGRTTGIKTILLGGILNPGSFELTGPFSLSILKKISLDFSFIGVNGIDDNGPGTVDEYEAAVNGMLADRATRPIVLADSSKFGQRSFSSLGNATTIPEIITDSDISEENIQHFSALGYTIHIAR